MQDNRIEASVWGWGSGDECALVDHVVIPGDPAQSELWSKLDAYLSTRFAHERGGTLGVEAATIDTGGHFTHQVYSYVRERSPGRRIEYAGHVWVQRLYAGKGLERPGLPVKGRSSPVDVNYRGKLVQRGVMLWMVGTNSAKDWWYSRLKQELPGPGYVHVPVDVSLEWCEQMTVESRVQSRTARGVRMVWQCPAGKRNEAWDCAVYALHAAHVLGLDRYTQAMWARLAERIAPVQGSLLGEAAPAPVRREPPPPTEPAPPAPPPAPSPRASSAPERNARDW